MGFGICTELSPTSLGFDAVGRLPFQEWKKHFLKRQKKPVGYLGTRVLTVKVVFLLYLFISYSTHTQANNVIQYSTFRQNHWHARIKQFSAISPWKHQTSHILTYNIRKAKSTKYSSTTAFFIWSPTLHQYASGFNVFSWPPKPSLLFFFLHCHFSKLLKVGGGGGGCLLFVLKVFCFFIRYFSQAGFQKKRAKKSVGNFAQD